MKRIISMAVVLVITMAAMAQKGELAMNENISGKDHVSKNEKEATPVGKKPKAAFIFDVYGEIPTTKPVFEAEHYLGSDITGKWNTFIHKIDTDTDRFNTVLETINTFLSKPFIAAVENKNYNEQWSAIDVIWK